ncbi:MAG TPA: GNAT family N-acetyltransferase [Gaiellaceae bacterium]|nr:GNAT family N-acetyltransferase [Gaiellaceae bacterium]
MPTSSATDAFAKDPPAFLPVPADADVVDDARFYLTVASDGLWANVCRLVGVPFDDVVALAPKARIVWITDGSQEAELRALGCRDQDPPLTSYITAMATEIPPPEVPGVEVRRADDPDVVRAITRRGWGTARDEEDGWIAYVDGEPVAWANAIACAHGLFLTGGVTVPEARGRGAYRALVRARWDEAVRLGTPALVVHAEEASRRVLARIGFREVAPVVELVSGAC